MKWDDVLPKTYIPPPSAAELRLKETILNDNQKLHEIIKMLILDPDLGKIRGDAEPTQMPCPDHEGDDCYLCGGTNEVLRCGRCRGEGATKNLVTDDDDECEPCEGTGLALPQGAPT